MESCQAIVLSAASAAHIRLNGGLIGVVIGQAAARRT
jgi:hypothetical protein